MYIYIYIYIIIIIIYDSSIHSIYYFFANTKVSQATCILPPLRGGAGSAAPERKQLYISLSLVLSV